MRVHRWCYHQSGYIRSLRWQKASSFSLTITLGSVCMHDDRSISTVGTSVHHHHHLRRRSRRTQRPQKYGPAVSRDKCERRWRWFYVCARKVVIESVLNTKIDLAAQTTSHWRRWVFNGSIYDGSSAINATGQQSVESISVAHLSTFEVFVRSCMQW